jgi:hypothetical protein
MRTRVILAAILIVTLVGELALSVVSKGHTIEFEFPLGALSVLIFALAILGKRLPWAIAFVFSLFGAAFGFVFALTAPRDQAFGWLGAALYGSAALALWGLNPDLRASEPSDREASTGRV